MGTNKADKILKGLLPYLISITALVISYFALKEARLATRVEIEPLITFQHPDSFKGYELEFIIKNEGNVAVKNIVGTYVTARLGFPDKNSKELIMGPPFQIAKFLKKNEEKSYLINLEGQVEFSKTEIIKTPEGTELYVESGKGIFLGVKAIYRRVADSKLFEKTSYFFLWPKTSEIIVGDLKGWFAEPYVDIIKELEAAFPF
jgi:hypothetical protein